MQAYQLDDRYHAADEGEHDGQQEQTASHRYIHAPESYIETDKIRKQCI